MIYHTLIETLNSTGFLNQDDDEGNRSTCSSCKEVQ